MGTGFGIAALVFAIISLFVPVAGFFIALFALGLAVVAAMCGNKPFVIGSSIIASVSALMSPTIWLYGQKEPGVVAVFFLLFLALSIAPYVAIFIRSRLNSREVVYVRPTAPAADRRIEPRF